MIVLVAVIAQAKPDTIGFESDGVRIGSQLVTGRFLDLIQVKDGFVLASSKAVEPLSADLPVVLAPDRSLVVSPGVRITRADGAYVLSTHDVRKINVVASGQIVQVETPATIRVTPTGWDFGKSQVAAPTGATLPSISKAYLPLAAAPIPAPVKKVKVRRLFDSAPDVTGNPVESVPLRQLRDVSPSGF